MVNDKDRNDLDEFELTNDEVSEEIRIDSEIDEVEGRLEDKVKKLRSDLAEAQAEKREALEQLQRERADLLNTKKRLEEQTRLDRERAVARHVEELLPLCDSFDMAMNDPAWQHADSTWRKGVEGMYAQLMGLLASYGVTVLAPVGETFNPHEHEALIDNGGDGKITAVIQKGYKRGELVIRPTRVAVG
jgi:molecular chaperone GrpE